MGRSRVFSTSVQSLHLAVDGRRLPLSVIITAGQVRDNPPLLSLLDQIKVACFGPGRPRSRPRHLAADEAYSHPSTRRALHRRRSPHSIPERSDQKAHRAARGSRGGRPPAVDRDRYRGRDVVERCFNRLKQFRALATRYAERAAYYRATLLLAATVLWLRSWSTGHAQARSRRQAVQQPRVLALKEAVLMSMYQSADHSTWGWDDSACQIDETGSGRAGRNVNSGAVRPRARSRRAGRSGRLSVHSSNDLE